VHCEPYRHSLCPLTEQHDCPDWPQAAHVPTSHASHSPLSRQMSAISLHDGVPLPMPQQVR
jgi:hypothetical protein